MMSPVFLRKGRITMKNIKTRDLIYCALFAALTAIGAFLHFQLFQATITLQFFFTAMAGLLLGAKLGALSQLLYVVLGLVGVPIFAAGGGFGYIFNPTFGFLLGLIPTAWVIGKIAEKDRSVPRLLVLISASSSSVGFRWVMKAATATLAKLSLQETASNTISISFRLPCVLCCKSSFSSVT